jgi:hypothetical protein
MPRKLKVSRAALLFTSQLRLKARESSTMSFDPLGSTSARIPMSTQRVPTSFLLMVWLPTL